MSKKLQNRQYITSSKGHWWKNVLKIKCKHNFASERLQNTHKFVIYETTAGDISPELILPFHYYEKKPLLMYNVT